MQLAISIQQVQRMTLVQMLGLESRYLNSCLVQTEALLRHSEFQKPLSLVRHRGEDSYHSVLDYLLVLFFPALKPAVLSYYRGDGPPLIEAVRFAQIVALDEALACRVVHLAIIHDELRELGWRTGTDINVLVDCYLEFVARQACPPLSLLAFERSPQRQLASHGGLDMNAAANPSDCRRIRR
jgi:hypothetical protein